MAVKIAAGVSGRKLVLTDTIGAPQRRRLMFQSAAAGVVLATPGGPADPTIAGAHLDVFNPLFRRARDDHASRAQLARPLGPPRYGRLAVPRLERRDLPQDHPARRQAAGAVPGRGHRLLPSPARPGHR